MVGPKNIDSTPALSVAGTYQARIEVPMGGVDAYLCWGARSTSNEKVVRNWRISAMDCICWGKVYKVDPYQLKMELEAL